MISLNINSWLLVELWVRIRNHWAQRTNYSWPCVSANKEIGVRRIFNDFIANYWSILLWILAPLEDLRQSLTLLPRRQPWVFHMFKSWRAENNWHPSSYSLFKQGWLNADSSLAPWNALRPKNQVILRQNFKWTRMFHLFSVPSRVSDSVHRFGSRKEVERKVFLGFKFDVFLISHLHRI